MITNNKCSYNITIHCILTVPSTGSNLCPRFDRERQKWNVRSLCHRPSQQSEETHQDYAPRIEPRLEREILLVSSILLFRCIMSIHSFFITRLIPTALETNSHSGNLEPVDIIIAYLNLYSNFNSIGFK